MADLIPVPELGPKGWIIDIGDALNNLMAHTFESDASSTTVAPGSITSFANLVKKYGANPDEMVIYTKNAYTTYLRKYVPSIEVDVTWEYADSNNINNGKYVLKITLTANVNGVSIDVGKYLSIDGSVFSEIAKINNG